MSRKFALNHESLAADPRYAALGLALAVQRSIDSNQTFNRYCQEACRLWRIYFPEPVGETSARFAELVDRIEDGGQNVIKTAWGGVVITRYEPPHVEKFLVIREGGSLALEMHEQKDEHLEILEGAGLILWRRHTREALTVEVLRPATEFHFEPGVEHCLIGTENLLVLERSIDPKGMDQDLIFIYQPEQN